MTRALALAFAACVLSGCPAPVFCDRFAQADTSMKAAACPNVPPAAVVLGASKETCTMRTAACAANDQLALEGFLRCVGSLEACAPGQEAAFRTARDACYQGLMTVTESCRATLMVESPDAGPLAPVDAGPLPVSDGGNGVDLIVVANETTFALAWSNLQPATSVQEWALYDQGSSGSALLATLRPGALVSATFDGGNGASGRQLFLVGYDSQGIALGRVDAGAVLDAGVGDGGSSNCTRNVECAVDQVCSGGRCRRESCVPGGPRTCPADYECDAPAFCLRQPRDAGTFDAGMGRDAGQMLLARPMISNLVPISLGPVSPGPVQPAGSFIGVRPDIAAIDSARVVMALQQDTNVVAHFSSRRGRDFVTLEAETTSIIDTRGSDVRLTYNPESRIVYACYISGIGARVRASRDFGRTWGPEPLVLEPPVDADGGISTIISKCDVAPWLNGGALLLTAEGSRLLTRALTPELSPSQEEVAFVGNDEIDAGVEAVGSASNPALATLASERLVHITFTGLRVVNSMGQRRQAVYGVFRSPAAGYGQPAPLLGTQLTMSPFLRDFSTVAIDPKTRRAVAAVTSMAGPSNAQYSTVFVCTFNQATGRWVTDTDLDVQYLNSMSQHVVLPMKRSAVAWDAFSPSLSVSGNGDVWLGFVAGERDVPGVGNDYKPYVVRFDYAQPSPAVAFPGWFIAPAQLLGNARVRDPRSGAGAPAASVGAIAADQQISVYGAFVEGLGAAATEDGRGLMMSRP
jgi:hypothetical protein